MKRSLIKAVIGLLLTSVSGCMVPVFLEERIIEPALGKTTPTTRPWHFEGEKVVYDGQ